MKYINLFFLLSVLAPMAVRANVASGIGATEVPFQRIFDAVQGWPQLYDTDFVFLLGERVTDKKYTLQKVAQACIDYADYSDDVNPEICKEFVAAAFGQSDVDQPVIEESSEADTNGVTLTTTDDMPAGAGIKITIYAAGQFEVDCDNDGTVEHEINSNTIVKEEVLCEYDEGGEHNIKITGLATDYPKYDAEYPGVIYFNQSPYLKSVQGSLGSIFPTLKGGKQPIFAYAFSDCTGLTTILPDLFDGVTGKADGMFDSTFLECESLTTIPENLFKGVTGAAAKMFASTFLECESLTTIPENLFKGVTGAAEEMFFSTFDSCTGLREIPTGLFDGVNAAADGMFRATFYGCNALTTIPEDLFDNVNGAAAEMFFGTFYGVPEGEVPAKVNAKMEDCNLPSNAADTGTAAGYGNVTLTTTDDMPAGAEIKITIYAAGQFNVDCENDGKAEHEINSNTIVKEEVLCEYDAGGVHDIKITGLATDYPEHVDRHRGVIYFNQSPYLKSVQGSLGAIFPTLNAGKQPPFAYAFEGCSALTTIPTGLFSNVNGAATRMFQGTFRGCSALTTIPDGLFDGVNGAEDFMFFGTFSGCSALTTIPEDLFKGVKGKADDMFAGTFYGVPPDVVPDNIFPGVNDAADTGTAAGGGSVTLTTTYMPAATLLIITIHAAGQFNVDCNNDGKVEHEINHDTIKGAHIWCISAVAGEYEIKITGRATDYPKYVDGHHGVIYFNQSPYLKSVQGSLGSIFPTLNGGKQPNFAYAFSGCSGLTEIPADLFDGVNGAADGMFNGTFAECSDLTKIPDGLFDGVKGRAAKMFYGTFAECSDLTTIPPGLFDGVEGAAAEMFYGTFAECSDLTTIPPGLFDGVTGAADGMFCATFANCSALTKIPDDLFKGVKGKAAEMFYSTFDGCTSLTKIPDGLFDGVKGAAVRMFERTFAECSALTTIPDGLFDGVNAAAAEMFLDTFYGVLPGAVPGAVIAKMVVCNL